MAEEKKKKKKRTVFNDEKKRKRAIEDIEKTFTPEEDGVESKIRAFFGVDEEKKKKKK